MTEVPSAGTSVHRLSARNTNEDGMTKQKRDNLVSAGIAAASVVFLLWVIPTFTPPYPGYGVSAALLPNLIVGLILLLSLVSLGVNLFGPQKNTGQEELPDEDKVHLGRLFSFLLPCLLLFPAIKLAGFIPSGIVFMLLIQFFCGQRKPVTMVLVAVCSVGFMYALMRFGLKIPMP